MSYALGSYYHAGLSGFDRAFKRFAIAAKGMRNSPDLLSSIAYIWRRQGLYDEAKGYLAKAMILDPTQFWYPLQLGNTCMILGQYAEAERYIDRPLALEPNQISSYIFKSLKNVVRPIDDLGRVSRDCSGG